MGRYLTGDHAFSYGYGEQRSNLVRLAALSRAGAGFVEPILALRFASNQVGPDLMTQSVVEIVRDAVRRTGVRPPSLLLLGDTHRAAIPARWEGMLRFLIRLDILVLIRELDARLPAPAIGAGLHSHATYFLDREAWPDLLTYINRHLSAPLTLAQLRSADRVEVAVREAGDADDFLVRLALRVLEHAHTHALPTMTVREEDPGGVFGQELWLDLLEELTSSADTDAALAIGVLSLWSGDEDAAITALRAARRDDPRALRWLAAAIGASREANAPTPAPGPPSDAPHQHVLDAALRESAQIQHRLDELMRLSHDAHADAAAILAALELPGGLDPLVRRLEVGPTTHALSAMSQHGDVALMRRALDAVGPRWAACPGQELPAVGTLKYNLACLAARTGDKPAMLRWLRDAAIDGEDSRDALTDSDFAAWDRDPELLAVIEAAVGRVDHGDAVHAAVVDERHQEKLNLPVEDLEELTIRTLNILIGAGVSRVGDLVRMNQSGELSLVPGLSRKGYDEICSVLDELFA